MFWGLWGGIGFAFVSGFRNFMFGELGEIFVEMKLFMVQ